MKDRKRRIEVFSFFNHTTISEHLEKMAQKGWMIEKVTNFGWIYRRIEPQKVHFAVSYYPKASEFDPYPTQEQEMFYDFCEHTGWKLASSSAQLQIFYNERENPTPIETEPKLELAAIHASAKKNFIPAYVVLMVLGLLQGLMFISSFLGDPIDLFSSPSWFFSGFCWFLVGILCVVELGSYFIWYKRAKVVADEQGELLKVPNTSPFQKIVLGAVLLSALYWVINLIILGDRLERWIAVLFCIYLPVLFISVNGVKKFLKNKKASRRLNRNLTIIASFVISFALIGIITFGTIFAGNHGLFAAKGEEVYEHGGMKWVAYQDELPLTVEDLLDIESDDYIKERRGDESFLLGEFVFSQYPRFDSSDFVDLPRLEYTVVDVKADFLYEMCKERLIYEKEYLLPLEKREYRPQDAENWGANEVYRLYDSEYGPRDDYLLCYDNLLVEISFDWEITSEQMKIVGEKLGNL